jgi:U3 small nucleolar RNA-associated protein 14
MPGRQSHGKAPTKKSGTKPVKKTRAKARAHALDAYAIATEKYPVVEKKTPRWRQLQDPDAGQKHERESEEDESRDEDAPQRKRARPSRQENNDDEDVEYGSDSEGNEWRIGGPINENEDSEIESDDAFGESDDDKFQGFSFGRSKRKDADEVCDHRVTLNPERLF